MKWHLHRNKLNTYTAQGKCPIGCIISKTENHYSKTTMRSNAEEQRRRKDAEKALEAEIEKKTAAAIEKALDDLLKDFGK